MGGCFSTEDQQDSRLATSPAIWSSGNNPKLPETKLTPSTPAPARGHRPGAKTNTQRSYHQTSKANIQRPRPRPNPKNKNIQRSKSTESLPGDLLRALEEIWAEEEEEEARHPKILVPERPFSAPPTQSLGRHLSIISAPPQAEFPIMPELACPVLPPDGVFFDGYVPPVPKKIPLDHPPPAAALSGGSAYPESDTIYEEHLTHVEAPIDPPQGIPAPPRGPDSVQEELLPTGAADDQHPLAAELPSQRPAAELAGQLPPTELDSTLVANPVGEELRIKYRDAVPFAPNFTELPAQLPPARSASMYAPHLVGYEWEQDKAQ